MSQLPRRSFARRVTLIHVAVSVLWKLLSILAAVMLASNTNYVALSGTLQGPTRIAFTAAILYALLRHEENSADSTPANCVALGLHHWDGADLVLSSINRGGGPTALTVNPASGAWLAV